MNPKIPNWKFWLLIIIPLLLLPLVFMGETQQDKQKFRCAYTIILMGVFWMLELMPLAITALLPVVLFPVLGILSTAQVTANYMKETSMMFVGGISLALALQYSDLHKRIALKIMIIIGSSQWRLLLGVLVTTMLLSCVVVVNTAVAAMMIPIISGLIESLDHFGEEKRSKLKKLYMLAVGYAANIGGTATIIGSQPNLIFKELIAQENIGQGGKYTDMNFATFIAYSMPIAIINVLLIWLILGLMYLDLPSGKILSRFSKRKNSSSSENGSIKSENVQLEVIDSQELNKASTEQIGKILRQKYNELGPVNFHQGSIMCLLTVAVLLWLTRDPQIFPGWFSLFGDGHTKIGDPSVAVAIVIILFIIPKDLRSFRKDFSGTRESLLTWGYIHEHFPWNIILLVGGGLAISDGANTSGLSKWLGEELNGLENLSHPVILLVLLIFISCFTEVMSNSATISLLTPILIALSKRLNKHPLYLSLPGGIACQYAFMLPTSNPPNAIVFTAGNMKISDMVKAGFFLNFACLIVLYLMNISWGDYVIFNYRDYAYPNITANIPLGG